MSEVAVFKAIHDLALKIIHPLPSGGFEVRKNFYLTPALAYWDAVELIVGLSSTEYGFNIKKAEDELI